MFSVTYSDGEMSFVSSEMFRSRQFSTGAAPVSFVFCAVCVIQMLHSSPKFKNLPSVNEDLTNEFAARLDSCRVRK